MKKVIIMLSVFAFFFISSHSANSMCVYNDSEVKNLPVGLSCGLFCSNEWILQPCPICPNGKGHCPTPDCYACRPGKGGKVSAPCEVVSCVRVQCEVEVADHGWVVIRGGTDEFKITCKAHL